MGRYDAYSREELIRTIEELEAGEASAQSHPVSDKGRYGERFAAKILQSLPDMLTVLNPSGKLVDLVSSAETNHVGVPTDELIGLDIREILGSEAYRNVKRNLDKAFTTGDISVAHHDIKLEGQTHNYENRIIPLDESNALCVCRDITDSEKAKHELEMVKYALNNVEEEIYACSLDGTLIYQNERYRSAHGLKSELCGEKVYELWRPAGTQRQWLERVANVRADEGVHKYTMHEKGLVENDVLVWDIVAYLIYDKMRREDVIWFFARNVTHRMEQESRVKEMNIIMQSILNNIPVYLFVKDPGNEFRYLYWNRAFEQFSQIPASKALGHTDFEIFPNYHDAEKFRHDDLDLLRSGERMSFEEEYVSASGETRTVSTSKALVPVEDRLPLIIGVSWDITDRKRVEAEIIRARNKAEESDRLKSAFLANMSHEIRTPLNAIVGFSKLMNEASSEDEKQQFAEIIDTNSDLLIKLINDILDLSKIEVGAIGFSNEPMELEDVFRAQYEIHRLKTKPGVELVLDPACREGTTRMICDQHRLAQVVGNLIGNAIKFTAQGEIRFGFSDAGQWVDCYVSDTGVGISPEKIHTVFDRFIKLNDFAVGSGLGLAISRMIVERMGGQIGVESQPGDGTRFWFRIPKECCGGDPCQA